MDKIDSLPSAPASIKTGCSGVHVAVSMKDGKPYRVLIQMGRGGGCRCVTMEALARTINWGLRAGGNLLGVAQQLKGLQCPRPVDGKNLSCYDGLGIVMKNIAQPPHDIEVGVESKLVLEDVIDPTCPKGG